MKTKIILFILLAVGIFSCDEENKVVDPIHEFVSFKGASSINLNEQVNSEEAYPVVVQLSAFEPYQDDITLTLEISGHNTEENVDFMVTPHETLKISAGSLVSDTIFIKTIDNASGSTEERSFDIKIKSVNKNIKIGLGIAEPKNALVTVNILDDECSETISVFNSTGIVNTIDYGSGGVIKSATGIVNNNTVNVTGDLIDYSPFSNAALTIILTPESEGSTKGSATFGEQETGADSDGYEYKFVEVGEGTYDVCSGVINIEYDIYYMDGDWTYWYTVTNVISVP